MFTIELVKSRLFAERRADFSNEHCTICTFREINHRSTISLCFCQYLFMASFLLLTSGPSRLLTGGHNKIFLSNK